MWDALTGRLGQRAVCLGAIIVMLWQAEVDWVLSMGIVSLALIMEFVAYISGMGDGIHSVIQMPPERVDEIRQLLEDNDDK